MVHACTWVEFSLYQRLKLILDDDDDDEDERSRLLTSRHSFVGLELTPASPGDELLGSFQVWVNLKRSVIPVDWSLFSRIPHLILYFFFTSDGKSASPSPFMCGPCA